MFQIGYYITNTNMGKVLDARVEPVLSSSAVESVVFRLNGPLVRRLFLCFFDNMQCLLQIMEDSGRSYK